MAKEHKQVYSGSKLTFENISGDANKFQVDINGNLVVTGNLNILGTIIGSVEITETELNTPSVDITATSIYTLNTPDGDFFITDMDIDSTTFTITTSSAVIGASDEFQVDTPLFDVNATTVDVSGTNFFSNVSGAFLVNGAGSATLNPDGAVILKNYRMPDTDGTAGQAMVSDGAGNISFSSISNDGGVSGEATKLATARDIQVSGAVAGTASFDGSANINIVTTSTSNPTLTLGGDASGSTTFANLGSATLTVTVADDSHNHVIANIDDFAEEVQAIVGAMVSENTQSGMVVTYQDSTGAINFDVNDPVISITGDVSGSATMSNLSNTNIVVTLAETQSSNTSGNAATATKLATARNIQVSGAVTGTASFDGTSDINIETTASIQSPEKNVVASSTSAVESLTNQLTFTSNIDTFKVGNNIRIFGASATQETLSTAGLSLSAEVIGFSETSGNDTIEFSYRIAQFDLSTGRISPAISEILVEVNDSDIVNFNNTNNIQLTFSRKNANTGILIYRKTGNDLSHKLVVVLESLGIGSSTASLPWTDYYDYDRVDWSKKDFTNAYTPDTGLVHFTLAPPENSLYGWIDTTIDGIDYDSGVVSVTELFYSQGTSTVYKDDTQHVQTLVDLNSSLNINSLRLDTRDYYITSLIIPSEFSLSGGGNGTKLIKMPWSSLPEYNFNTIIKSKETFTTNIKSFALRDMYINGNAQNQYLTDDSRNLFNNYAIYTYGAGLKCEGVTLENVIGGGAYLYNEDFPTSDIFFNKCTIRNGTLSYRYNYSPYLATAATDMNTTQNNFSNFPKHVDVNSIRRSIVTNNIINNCGSGLFAFGIINSIINPNVIVGPAGEYLQGPDVLNSEFDSVNIKLEPGVDYVSPSVVYQESGELFDLTANQGSLSFAINELRKINGVEVISTDYSETISGTSYISFINSTDKQNGEIQFRIQESLIDNLLSRANYETLFQNNQQSLGLIYRVFHTEYVPQSNISAVGTYLGSNIYRVPVENAAFFSTNDVVRLVDHATTPTVATTDGFIANINTITNRIDIQYDFPITSPGNSGAMALKNTFLVLKGTIN